MLGIYPVYVHFAEISLYGGVCQGFLCKSSRKNWCVLRWFFTTLSVMLLPGLSPNQKLIGCDFQNAELHFLLPVILAKMRRLHVYNILSPLSIGSYEDILENIVLVGC